MRKLIAIILTISVVIPLLLSAGIAVSAASWALDRHFYIDAFSQPQVTQALTSSLMIRKMLHESLGLPPEANTSELEYFLQSIITPDYVRAQMGAIVDTLFDYLQGKTDTFEPTLDITQLKAALDAGQQDAFLRALLAALPACTPGQIPGFDADETAACKPGGVPDEVIIEMALKPALPTILSAVPDEIPLEGEFQDWQQAARWRTFLPGMAVPASIMLSVLVLVFIAAGTWYLTALVSDPSWRGRLQWLGWTLLVPAALIFLLGIATQSGMPAYWINFGLERSELPNTVYGLEINELLRAVSLAALPRVASAFQMAGTICGAASLALIFWGIATPRQRRGEFE